VQRGVKFSVEVPEGKSRGYICEVFKSQFILPDRGVIGANSLANERDFETPVAFYEDTSDEWTVVNKF